MPLLSVIDSAFERGTETSAHSAKSSARLRELEVKYDHDNPSYNKLFGLVELLGERLADRAFKNLPAHIRRLAPQWHDSSTGTRKTILTTVFKELNAPAWRKIKRPYVVDDPGISVVLPAECRSWTRGQVRPNCLGMTQALIGFARRAGMKYVMVNTLTRKDEMQYRLHLKTLQEMNRRLQLLDDSIIKRKLQKSLDRNIRSILKSIATVIQDKQGHHCLLLEVSDGEWCLLDPYLDHMGQWDVKSIADACAEIHESIMAAPRAHRSMQFDRDGQRIGTERLIDEKWIEFTKLASLDSRGLTFADLERLARFESFDFDSDEFDRLMLKDPDDVSDEEMSAYLSIGGRFMVRPSLDAARSIMATQLADYLSNGSPSILWMYRSLVFAHFTLLSNFMIEIMNVRTHHLLEAVHPAFHLGLATLHHIVVTTEKHADPLALVLQSSQFILYDCVRTTPRTDPHYAAIEDAISLTRLRFADQFIMPELLTWLPRKEE